MKFRRVLSVVAVALTGLAAKAFRRRRRLVVDLRQRMEKVSDLLAKASLVLRALERELTFASNPPGSVTGSKPISTLAELVSFRDRAGAIRSRSLELPTQSGLLVYVQIKAVLTEFSAIEADAATLSQDVEAFSSSVRSARNAGERLP
jgi:hypothetical protein